ncbi:adenosylmethionine decarboxylase [Endozoicomonadaceae bacterium StTr2]
MQTHRALAAALNEAPYPDNPVQDISAPHTSTGHEVTPDHEVAPDHFVVRDGKVFAGTHLIIDLWDAKYLDDLEKMESALRRSVEVAGATLLHIHLHHFTPEGGISGVAVLAESHISVHTWPERNFAAFDIFMCGDAVPSRALSVLEEMFMPGRMNVSRHLRGIVQEGVQ